MIPLSAPNINGNEWNYIKECLDTEWVSSAGKYVDLFEQKIAKYMTSHSISTTVSPENVIFIKDNSGIPGCEEDDSCLFN